LNNAVERLNHVGAAVARSNVDRRRVAAEQINDGQNVDLAAIKELVVNEVDGLDLIR
jgi:hypothetical protein